MRILLINPANRHLGAKREEACTGACTNRVLPSQIFLCARYLRDQGWNDVQVSDRQVEKDPLDYAEYDVVIGWASTNVNLSNDIQPLREAKAAGARTAVVVQGAPHMEKEVLETYPEIDVAIRYHERESTINELLADWSSGGDGMLPGVVSRDATTDQISDGGLVSPTKDCHHLGSIVPLLEEKLTVLPQYPRAFILSGKGCPYKCTFCKFAHTGIRHRQIADIVSEVGYIKDYIRDITILDEELLVDGGWAGGLCEGLTGLDITWSTLTRADHVTEKSIKMLYRAGCRSLLIGAESADNEILRRIGKGYNSDTLIEAARLCHSVGILPHFAFMVGFPWDSMQSLNQYPYLFDLLKPMVPEIQMVQPFRGTKLYQEMKDVGMFDKGEPTLKDYCDTDVTVHPMFGTLFVTKQDLYVMRTNLLRQDWTV